MLVFVIRPELPLSVFQAAAYNPYLVKLLLGDIAWCVGGAMCAVGGTVSGLLSLMASLLHGLLLAAGTV